MRYFDVFERQSNGDLKWIAQFRDNDSLTVMNEFRKQYGQNYGTIVVLPTPTGHDEHY